MLKMFNSVAVLVLWWIVAMLILLNVTKKECRPVCVTFYGNKCEVGIWSCMRIVGGVTPTATFIENRLRLGHPSKLVVLSLYCFCAYSAH